MTTTHRVNPHGMQEWRSTNGALHRDGDKPALVFASGTQMWFRQGELHRDGDKPAVVFEDGSLQWWLGGRMHRDGDNPAAMYFGNCQQWWHHGVACRGGDKPAVISTDGQQQWWANGKHVRTTRVTNFQETSERFAFVQVIVRVCSKCTAAATHALAGTAVHCILATAQACEPAESHHVTCEYALLVALFL